MIKIVPQLNEVGFDNWLKALQIVAYSEDWYNVDALLTTTNRGGNPAISIQH